MDIERDMEIAEARAKAEGLKANYRVMPERVFLNITMHYTIWSSRNYLIHDIETYSQVFREVFDELKKWPGIKVNVHFDAFTLEKLKEFKRPVFDTFKDCVSLGIIELMKGELIDYNAMITPLEDVGLHYDAWDDYIKHEFGVETGGLFVWPNELQYHPNLPRIWRDHGISGIVLNPLNPEMREYVHEPLELLGEGGSSSHLVVAINDDTKPYEEGYEDKDISRKSAGELYLWVLRSALDYASRRGFGNPIVSFAQDINLFHPEKLSRLFELVKSDPLMATIGLGEYVREFKPRRKIYIDQGNWDTFYEWDRSAAGWFTQQPFHLHINGLSYLAYRKVKQSEYLMDQLGGDVPPSFHKYLEEARHHLLMSERSTSRAHWCHPGPRKWVQDEALRSIDTSNQLLDELKAGLAGTSWFSGGLRKIESFPDVFAAFGFLNPVDCERDDLVRCTARFRRGQINLAEFGLIDSEGGRIPVQVLRECRYSDGSLRECDIAAKLHMEGGGVECFGITTDSGEPREPRASSQGSNCPSARISDDKAHLENDFVSVVMDLTRGGQIAEYRDKPTGTNFIASGGGFEGTTFGEDFDGHGAVGELPETFMHYEALAEKYIHKGKLITDASSLASAEVITQGALVAGIRVTTRTPEGILKNVEYYLERGTRLLECRIQIDFGENPTLFQPDHEYCARLGFVANLGQAQRVSWRMPGGPIREKDVPDKWSGFVTKGWVNLRDEDKGVALFVKLHPNGPRMICLRPNYLGLAISGARTYPPYYKTAASFGKYSYQFSLLPHFGIRPDECERTYRVKNDPLMLVYDKARYDQIELKYEEEIKRVYTREDFTHEF